MFFGGRPLNSETSLVHSIVNIVKLGESHHPPLVLVLVQYSTTSYPPQHSLTVILLGRANWKLQKQGYYSYRTSVLMANVTEVPPMQPAQNSVDLPNEQFCSTIEGFPMQEVLCAEYFMDQYKPELITMLLDHLTPRQARYARHIQIQWMCFI